MENNRKLLFSVSVSVHTPEPKARNNWKSQWNAYSVQNGVMSNDCISSNNRYQSRRQSTVEIIDSFASCMRAFPMLQHLPNMTWSHANARHGRESEWRFIYSDLTKLFAVLIRNQITIRSISWYRQFSTVKMLFRWSFMFSKSSYFIFCISICISSSSFCSVNSKWKRRWLSQ